MDTRDAMAALTPRAERLLGAWGRWAEHYWYGVPGRPEHGCFGTGYGSWGVQTQQKYLAAMAVLATRDVDGVDRDHALRRALAALRLNLASHLAGPPETTCTDGQKWGHTWISALGVERMMHGVAALEPHLTEDDRAALRAMLTSEAEWIYASHRRGSHHGVFGDRWNHSGKNAPESNLWNGALLWRAASMYPTHPQSRAWKERAHEFLINAVSVPADAEDERVIAGAAVRERFRGANFFSSYALDHHGYLNVGYMAICVSNAAILHFDLRAAEFERPDTLDHHQADLWAVLRRMVFADGRLARIGGDSRVRYTYCQEYLLPALLYAADHLADGHAVTLASRQIEMMEREAETNGDGSFYGRRLAAIAEESPYYYTRLESDRANALSMLLAWAPLVKPVRPTIALEAEVSGGWVDHEHGAVLDRCPTRFASFSWRAYGLAQGLCLPPDDGGLAEWFHNLTGSVRFMGDDGVFKGAVDPHRRLLRYHIETFPGGFATCGSVMEGVDLSVAEGWQGTDSATHHIAVCALPDEHTVVVMQLCIGADRRLYTRVVKGLQFGLPNDPAIGSARTVRTPEGVLDLTSPPPRDEVIDLHARWALLAERIGVVGVYGAESLAVSRSEARRGGKFASLHIEELCWGLHEGVRAWDAGSTLLDTGCIVLSGVGGDAVQRLAAQPELGPLRFENAPLVRGVSLVSMRGVRRAVLANFGEEESTVTLPSGRSVTIPAGRATVV